MEIAGTDKHIDTALENISELSSQEYLELYSCFLNFSSWYDYSIQYIGTNYLMLLHERDPERFRSSFPEAFRKTFTALNSEHFYDAFDALCKLFAVMDKDIYDQLLKMSIEDKPDISDTMSEE